METDKKTDIEPLPPEALQNPGMIGRIHRFFAERAARNLKKSRLEHAVDHLCHTNRTLTKIRMLSTGKNELMEAVNGALEIINEKLSDGISAEKWDEIRPYIFNHDSDLVESVISKNPAIEEFFHKNPKAETAWMAFTVHYRPNMDKNSRMTAEFLEHKILGVAGNIDDARQFFVEILLQDFANGYLLKKIGGKSLKEGLGILKLELEGFGNYATIEPFSTYLTSGNGLAAVSTEGAQRIELTKFAVEKKPESSALSNFGIQQMESRNDLTPSRMVFFAEIKR